MTEADWAVRLFNKSVMKQRKFKEVIEFLGPTDQLNCLDIGGDNGIISYMLRKKGGDWKSADLDRSSVDSIQKLVHTEVYQIDGNRTPFKENEFDRVAIVDFLEHIPNDDKFIAEMYRIMKPGGVLVVNVPNIKDGILRKLRMALGQTDEKHGHLRAGYTLTRVERLLGNKFTCIRSKTYSKFFSELIDIIVVCFVTRVKQGNDGHSKKGQIVTQQDFQNSASRFRLYSFVYPFIRFISMLDSFLFFRSGYMLIVSARVIKVHEEGI
jgi:2-polyprenyl-3-methyl-5-hydroxy-6-metoxy-1,4-benzoquinol methylase